MSFQMVQTTRYQGCWRSLRHACATGIVSAYSLAYLLASLCLATGAFHPSVNAPSASERHDPQAHDHHHDAPSNARWLDICDFALQAILAPASMPTPERIAVWGPGEVIRGFDNHAIPTLVSADPSIRSPPLFAMV